MPWLNEAGWGELVIYLAFDAAGGGDAATTLSHPG